MWRIAGRGIWETYADSPVRTWTRSLLRSIGSRSSWSECPWQREYIWGSCSSHFARDWWNWFLSSWRLDWNASMEAGLGAWGVESWTVLASAIGIVVRWSVFGRKRFLERIWDCEYAIWESVGYGFGKVWDWCGCGSGLGLSFDHPQSLVSWAD